jgi:hypothetical protein
MEATTTERAPALRLGETSEDGIAAGLYPLVERGVARRAPLAREMRGLVELRFTEDIESVRLSFDGDSVVVEDGSWESPTLVITGRLPHIVHLATAPTVAGVPNPASRSGRAALARVTRGHLRVEGDRALARKLLRLLEI